MPPAYEVLLLNTAIPQIQAAQSGDTYVVPRDIAFSTVASFAAGAEATPSIVATGDTNTGIWFPAADTVAISTGGSSRMRLDSSGNLGIGTSSPGAKLAVIGTSGSLSNACIRVNSTTGTQSANSGLWLSGNQSTSHYNWLLASQYNLNATFEITPSTAVDGATFSNPVYAVTNAGLHKWYNGTTQAMTLDASGNLGIGETSPSTYGKLAVLKGAGTSGGTDAPTLFVGTPNYGANTLLGTIQIGSTAGSNAFIGYGGRISSYAVAGIDATDLRFYNSNTERARITSGGYFKASNDGTYLNAAGTYHEINQTANDNILFLRSTDTAYSVDGVQLRFSRNTTNNSFYVLSYYNATAAAYKFRIADSGDVTNTNGTYGTISDAKMKTDIVDAGSQWSDIKALRFRKFKMKDDPSGLVQLGVVAQEVEQTSPGLVDEHADKDAEGNDLGTTTKSVKTSVLLMKAAVALQEAMARIEKLEAKVAALEGA